MDTANRDKVGAVMMVGSGIAGIQASLDLANAGFYVYLVEKEPAIGGVMPQLDKTFPTNDCSMCIISPKLVDCANHRNIEILAPAEMVGLSGVRTWHIREGGGVPGPEEPVCGLWGRVPLC
jgi:heterodisulfide reductase subunit A